MAGADGVGSLKKRIMRVAMPRENSASPRPTAMMARAKSSASMSLRT